MFGKYLEDTNVTDLTPGDRAFFDSLSKHFLWTWSGAGTFGNKSTGVFSQADLNANEEGFKFYSMLFDKFLESGSKKGAQPPVFRVSAFATATFNERAVPNTFDKKLLVDLTDEKYQELVRYWQSMSSLGMPIQLPK